MDHIKNRPDTTSRPGGPVVEVALPDPNIIDTITPWQLNFTQIEPGPMQTAIRMRQGSVLTLLDISMDRAVHQQGLAPPDTLTFGVRLSGSSFRWRDGEVQANRFLTFGSKEGFEGLTDATFHGLTFSVPADAIEALADRLGLAVDPALWSSGVFNPSRDTQGIDRLADLALGHLSTHRGGAMDVAEEEEVLTTFLEVSADTSVHVDLSSGRQRARAMRIALDYMEAHVDENVPISRICDVSGASLRSLNRAFRETLGISPKAYFLRLRLSRFRRALIERSEARPIADSANALGFWHMGQLARDYRAQFGELPSATIA